MGDIEWDSLLKIYLISWINLINLNSIDLIEDRYKPDIDMTICFNAPKKNKQRQTEQLSY